jgi:hypothetical protein
MTDTDSEKLDEIIKKLEWMAKAIQAIGFQLHELGATARVKTSPEPPPKPQKRP